MKHLLCVGEIIWIEVRPFSLNVGGAIVQTEASDYVGRKQLSGHKHQLLLSFFLDPTLINMKVAQSWSMSL